MDRPEGVWHVRFTRLYLVWLGMTLLSLGAYWVVSAQDRWQPAPIQPPDMKDPAPRPAKLAAIPAVSSAPVQATWTEPPIPAPVVGDAPPKDEFLPEAPRVGNLEKFAVPLKKDEKPAGDLVQASAEKKTEGSLLPDLPPLPGPPAFPPLPNDSTPPLAAPPAFPPLPKEPPSLPSTPTPKISVPATSEKIKEPQVQPAPPAVKSPETPVKPPEAPVKPPAPPVKPPEPAGPQVFQVPSQQPSVVGPVPIPSLPPAPAIEPMKTEAKKLTMPEPEELLGSNSRPQESPKTEPMPVAPPLPPMNAEPNEPAPVFPGIAPLPPVSEPIPPAQPAPQRLKAPEPPRELSGTWKKPGEKIEPPQTPPPGSFDFSRFEQPKPVGGQPDPQPIPQSVEPKIAPRPPEPDVQSATHRVQILRDDVPDPVSSLQVKPAQSGVKPLEKLNEPPVYQEPRTGSVSPPMPEFPNQPPLPIGKVVVEPAPLSPAGRGVGVEGANLQSPPVSPLTPNPSPQRGEGNAAVTPPQRGEWNAAVTPPQRGEGNAVVLPRPTSPVEAPRPPIQNVASTPKEVRQSTGPEVKRPPALKLFTPTPPASVGLPKQVQVEVSPLLPVQPGTATPEPRRDTTVKFSTAEPIRNGNIPTEPIRAMMPPVETIRPLTPETGRPFQAMKRTPIEVVETVATPSADVEPRKLSPSVTEPQYPQISVERDGPAPGTQKGRSLFTLLVRNTSKVAARQVRIEEELPPGTKMVAANFKPVVQGNKSVWSLPTVEGLQEVKLQFEVVGKISDNFLPQTAIAMAMPEIASTSTQSVANTSGTGLDVAVQGPEQGAVGQPVVFEIHLHNPGVDPLAPLTMQVHMSNGLSHVRGQSLTADIGALAAGARRTIKFPTTALQPGRHKIDVTVLSPAGNQHRGTAQVLVGQGGLRIQQTLTTPMLMDRDNEIKIEILNQSAEVLRQIALVDMLPEGLEFLQASDKGLFRRDDRAVTWGIDQLNPGQMRTFLIKVEPKRVGSLTNHVFARMGAGQEVKSSGIVRVDGYPDVRIEIDGPQNPPQGRPALYKVKLTNQGNVPATNVQLNGLLPNGLAPASGTQGPTSFKSTSQRIAFDAAASVHPGETLSYTFSMAPQTVGEVVFRVQANCDQYVMPLNREFRSRVLPQ